MKKLIPLFAALSLFIMIGCEGGLVPPSPNVTAQALVDEENDGEVLRLTWTAVTEADGYKIYVDGEEVADITETSYDINTPCKIIEVTAYNSAGESDPATIDLTPVKSEGEVYNRSVPELENPSGFGFNTDGEVVTYAIGNEENYPYIDFYIDDVAFTSPTLVSPWDDNSVVENDKGNAVAEGSETENVAPATGVGKYESRMELAEGGVYWLWLA